MSMIKAAYPLLATARRVAVHVVAGATLCVPLLGNLSLAQEPSQQPTSALPTEPEVAGGPPLIRRLTESEYRATVAQIFAPDIAIVGRFERGLRVDGLLA